MCDKVVAPNVSLTSSVSQCKEATKTVEKISEVIKSLPGQSAKQHTSSKRKKSTFYQDASLDVKEKVNLKLGTDVCPSLGELKLRGHFVHLKLLSVWDFSYCIFLPFDYYRASYIH